MICPMLLGDRGANITGSGPKPKWRDCRRLASASKSIEESRKILSQAGDAFLAGCTLADRAEFNFVMAWYSYPSPYLGRYWTAFGSS